MARYIDAARTADIISEKFNIPLCDLVDVFAEIPTANVVEVKRGEWKDRYNNKYYNHLYECSACGKEALYERYKNELDQWKERQALTPICPYCGAKIDGVRKEDV